eukprot:scaffold15677_cov74-Phaeocystis_antarctica.AAC.1
MRPMPASTGAAIVSARSASRRGGVRAHGEVRPASRDAGKGDAAAASDDAAAAAGDDGGAAAADDCDADADGSFAATVAAEDGGGADAEDGGGATSRTTATDEPGAAGSSRLDVEQTIGLLLELNANSARKSKAAAKVTAPT